MVNSTSLHKDIPGIPAGRPSKGIPDIPVFPVFPDLPVISNIPVIHDLPAFPGNSTSSSISRESTPFQHSPIRMRILHILHILQFDWFPQENSTEYQLNNTNYKHYILQRKRDVVISVKTCKTCIGQDVKMTYSPE